MASLSDNAEICVRGEVHAMLGQGQQVSMVLFLPSLLVGVWLPDAPPL